MHRCVGDLAKELEIVPSTVSHHLKELTQAGLITTERCGREIRCRVEPKLLRELGEFFTSFVAQPSGSNKRRSCDGECDTG